jgi:hypothetical protein
VKRGQRGERVRVGDGSADLEMRGGLRDGAQLGDRGHRHQQLEVPVLLRDLEAEIGRPRDQPRPGVLREEGRQRVQASWGEPSLAGVREVERLLALDAAEQIGQLAPRGAAAPAAVPVGLAHRLDDGAVAGAAAQVAGQRLVDPPPRGRLPLALVQREHRHHEPGRAEAALRAVAVDQRALHRVERAVGPPEALDREERLPVQRGEEEQAGVHGAEAHRPARQLAEHHRARAAIALGAAFLGAAAPLGPPQPLEHRRGRVDVRHRSHASVEDEAHRRRHRDEVTADPPEGASPRFSRAPEQRQVACRAAQPLR